MTEILLWLPIMLPAPHSLQFTATRLERQQQQLSSAVLALFKQKLAFLVPRPVFVLKKNISFNFLAGLPTLLCLCKKTAADCLSGNRFIKGTTSLFPETYLGENLLLLAAIHSVPNAYYASVPTIAPSTNTDTTYPRSCTLERIP